MGFGATIAWLQMGYVAGHALRAGLEIIRPDQWPFGGRDANCALDRFLELPRPQNDGVPRIALDPANKSNLRDWGYYDALDWSGCLFGYKPSEIPTLEEYRRSIVQECYRPTAFAREAVDSSLSFLPSRFVVWHVRRGDKTSGPAKEDDKVPLREYVSATNELLGRMPQPPRHLVVCTDSPDVLAEAQHVLRDVIPSVELVFDPTETRWDGYCALHRGGAITRIEDMVAEVLTAQKIIEIIRRADALVGCNSSYLFRVGAMLNSNGPCVSLSDNKRFRPYYPL